MKKIGFILIILVIVSISTSVMATDNTITVVNETENLGKIHYDTTYQDILDRLNNEYGTDVHFETEKRSGATSSVQINMSLEEFEAHIRSAIEANLRANAEADEKIRRLAAENKEDTTYVIFEKVDFEKNEKYSAVIEDEFDKKIVERGNVVYAYQDLKYVDGATISLGAYVNLDRGYWAFSSVFALDILHVPELNGTLWFYPDIDSCSYSFTDARRTCATEFYGIVRDETTGIVIDTNARRYAEFWAGKDMPDPGELMVS